MLHLHNILSGFWGFHPSLAYNYLPIVASFIKGDPMAGNRLNAESDNKRYNKDISRSERSQVQMMSVNRAYPVGVSWSDWRPNEIEEDAVAVITIRGAITKYSSCENYGAEIYASVLSGCYANPKIKGIVIVIDSAGGEARAMRIWADVLQQKNKAVIAYVSDACYSAAFGIASQCDAIFCNNEFAGVGSLGTMMTIMDQSAYFEKQGIKLIELYATASKEKNKEYRDIIAGNTDKTIARLNAVNDYFMRIIKSGRGDRLTAKQDEWGTGATWQAEEAVQMGLIDGIAPLGDVIDSIV